MANETVVSEPIARMSVPAAGAILGISRRSSYEWANKGMPGVIRRGRRLEVIRPLFLRGVGLVEEDLMVSHARQQGASS